MEEKKSKVVVFAFLALIVFSIFSILNIFKSYLYNFSVNGFNYPNKEVTLNIEFDRKIANSEFNVCFNNICLKPVSDNFNNVYSVSFDKNSEDFLKSKLKHISIIYDKQNNIYNHIETISMYVGRDSFYYNSDEILKFDKKTFKFETMDGKIKNYGAIILPFETNYKGVLNHFCNLFLSFFYNATIFIVPFFWLIVALYLYLYNKNSFNFKLDLNKKKFYIVSFVLILLLGIILRINEIDKYPLWLDEIYTKTVAISNFSSCFKDAGNPPLFYIIEFLFTKITSISLISIRFLPLLFGILFMINIFLLFKNMNKKLALFGLFFASINLINIYHSQEARVYSLCMALSVLSIYVLFKYIKENSNKNLLIYFILSVLLINSHYYMSLFLLSNFIYGSFVLIKNKKFDIFIKFLICNVVTFISFLPYLIFTFNNSLTTNFNSWISPVNLDTFKFIINEYFSNIYIFYILIAIIFSYFVAIILNNILKQDYIDKNRKDLFLYLIFSISFILISSLIISICFKPILHKRLLLSCYSLLFLLEFIIIIGIFNFKNKKPLKNIKYSISIVLFFVILSTIKPMPLRDIYVLDDFMSFVLNDSKKYNNLYEIHAVSNDTKDYLKNYPELEKNKYIKWHYVNTNSMEYIKSIKKSDFEKNGKRTIIYGQDMSMDIDNISLTQPNASVYQTNTIRNIKIKYE